MDNVFSNMSDIFDTHAGTIGRSRGGDIGGGRHKSALPLGASVKLLDNGTSSYVCQCLATFSTKKNLLKHMNDRCILLKDKADPIQATALDSANSDCFVLFEDTEAIELLKCKLYLKFLKLSIYLNL